MGKRLRRGSIIVHIIHIGFASFYYIVEFPLLFICVFNISFEGVCVFFLASSLN